MTRSKSGSLVQLLEGGHGNLGGQEAAALTIVSFACVWPRRITTRHWKHGWWTWLTVRWGSFCWGFWWRGVCYPELVVINNCAIQQPASDDSSGQSPYAAAVLLYVHCC